MDGWDAGVLSQLANFVQDSFRVMRTRRSAVHRDVIADVSDSWGIRRALLNQPKPRRRFTWKGLSWRHRGGGAVCTTREELNRVVERLKEKTRPKSLAGSANASRTQIIQGAINPASSRTGVGRVRGFGFVPIHVMMCVRNSSGAYRVVCNSSGAYRVFSYRRLFYQDRNQWTAGCCWRPLWSAQGGRLGRSLIHAGGGIRMLVLGGLFLMHQVFGWCAFIFYTHVVISFFFIFYYSCQKKYSNTWYHHWLCL